MNARIAFFICIFLLGNDEILRAQQATPEGLGSWLGDTLRYANVEELVVTATRSERQLANVTTPTLLVGRKEIQLSGNLRLNEVLQEQTGLFLTAGAGSGAVGGGVFGNGAQIQGMAPDYTLILLDGEPLIGRQGGVIDLSRFTVGNIRKIEIVKGPSSALYGSEAMGGVINIITEQRRENYLSGGLRYGQFRTSDAYLSANMHKGNATLYLFGNLNASQGYDLEESTPERTLDPYRNAAFQVKWTQQFSERTRLVWNNRFFTGIQHSLFSINSPEINVGGSGRTSDLNINPVLTHWVNDRVKTAFRLYASRYQYEQKLDFIRQEEQAEKPYYVDNFQHNFYRLENQTDWNWGEGSQLIVGAAYNLQTVETMRYRTTQTQHLGYFFAQQEWTLRKKWTIIPGLRYDLNSDFAHRLTPKFSAQYKVNGRLHFNCSYGSGFKAPDFRQLYLYYINPAAQGYRVYGASEFSLNELELQMNDGLIARILPEAYQVTRLRPEISHGMNLGGHYTLPNQSLRAEFNVFYNDVSNLINYLPVAVQSNNSLVFSYLNIRSAFTRGLELGLQGAVRKNLSWSAGYQYLQTGDRDVLRNLRQGEVYGRNTPQGATRRMRWADYTGLMGRSPHMLNLKLMYTDPASGWGGSARAVYRSRWGVTDLDGNGFANMREEYAEGFTMLNLSVQKTWRKSLTAQINLNNALNHIDPLNVPQMPGAHLMAALHWNFLN